MAALREGLPGTGPPSLAFGPPSLLARQIFGPSTFLCLALLRFLMVNEFITNLLNRLTIV